MLFHLILSTVKGLFHRSHSEGGRPTPGKDWGVPSRGGLSLCPRLDDFLCCQSRGDRSVERQTGGLCGEEESKIWPSSHHPGLHSQEAQKWITPVLVEAGLAMDQRWWDVQPFWDLCSMADWSACFLRTWWCLLARDLQRWPHPTNHPSEAYYFNKRKSHLKVFRCFKRNKCNRLQQRHKFNVATCS